MFRATIAREHLAHLIRTDAPDAQIKSAARFAHDLSGVWEKTVATRKEIGREKLPQVVYTTEEWKQLKESVRPVICRSKMTMRLRGKRNRPAATSKRLDPETNHLNRMRQGLIAPIVTATRAVDEVPPSCVLLYAGLIAIIACGTVGDSMQLKALTKKEHMARSIVLFLVVFTLLDLAYRMPCCIEETDICGGNASVVINAIPDDVSIITSDYSQTEHHSKSDVGSEGCFCCAHVLPGTTPIVSPLAVNVLVTDLKDNSIPSPPPNSPFHPPRLS